PAEPRGRSRCPGPSIRSSAVLDEFSSLPPPFRSVAIILRRRKTKRRPAVSPFIGARRHWGVISPSPFARLDLPQGLEQEGKFLRRVRREKVCGLGHGAFARPGEGFPPLRLLLRVPGPARFGTPHHPAPPPGGGPRA